MALEQPTYRVIEDFLDVEIREYDAFKVAEYEVGGHSGLRPASSIAFGKLFSYISGRNATSQKIAMTTPVRQVPTASGWKVSFVVPQGVADSGVPTPLEPGVAIVDVPGGLFAVHRYRGFWNSARFAEKSAHLISVIRSSGYKQVGDTIGAVYNPPMTPPPLRRNEVMVKVEKNV